MTGAAPRASHAGPDRFMKRDLSSPLKLVLRTYACSELCTLFALRLGELIEGARAFNGCFLLEEHGWLYRIGGMDLHGDILIRHETQADGFTVTIEHRAGDEGLVRELEQEMGKVLAPAPEVKLAITRSSRDSVKANSQPEIIEGAISGRVISKVTCMGRPPRSMAASSRDSSILASRACTITAM